MKRLLLYVHYHKYNKISSHVFYQLEKMRPLFSEIVFISNSLLEEEAIEQLKKQQLFDSFIQRENKGYDFAAWHDGMNVIGFDRLDQFDSVTCMNDTCFGPLWDMEPYFEKYESDISVDFWGMTNHTKVDTHHVHIEEHLQSYFMSFKRSLVASEVFQAFWTNIEAYDNVQYVIDNYETQYTKRFLDAGFHYQSVLNTVPIADDYFHSNFTIHYPHVILANKVPFVKVKTFDLTQHLSPYLLIAIEEETDYPVQHILDHMSDISVPTPAYLLGRKVLTTGTPPYSNTKKIAVHLHTFYVDLLEEFLIQFKHFNFDYDLFLTTDTEEKREHIQVILDKLAQPARIFLTGNKGRDIIPMLKLKEELANYDYIGHFHTKKSPEYPHWVGDSWRRELYQMLIKPANNILASLEQRDNLGLVIADIPSFFRYTKIVDPTNENKFAEDMNALWEQMGLSRALDFNQLDTFIMSYGTFIWFKKAALQPLFDLVLEDLDIPEEPIGQHTVLHSIERILVYLAWANDYDYAISRNPLYISPYVDNKVLNLRPDLVQNTYINFDQIGGIKGALKYIYRGPGSAIKYIIRRILKNK
ncbi:rhamnan synthesis F family protein [Streptococcus phocae]|uniref:Alpha-L-Rha alpha-1,3-L-rhamnosyltransferase n=1 Tax=Streptococcus phocae TaxID=119224 RepID=A0A0P6SKL3_9STRE|nr:rhamnan synthesis F family protein [Streptococcus phocae]KPJ22039.1 alpha-L-Rha alpha-1,3-L-rhamnosyltransferase [Streptococcus phocae]